MNSRTRIKVCGITNPEDALWAAQCGADALGFIYVPNTPRFVGAHKGACEVPSKTPPFVSRTAVCRALSEAPKTLGTNYDALQFYRYEEGLEAWRGRVWLIQAFRVRDATTLDQIAAEIDRFRPDALLLDAYHETHLGGAGIAFDWSLACHAKARFDLPILLAGGLTPDNVGEAIRQTRPFAVDVSSGLEREPGRKDLAKVLAFCEAVRAVDAE